MVPENRNITMISNGIAHQPSHSCDNFNPSVPPRHPIRNGTLRQLQTVHVSLDSFIVLSTSEHNPASTEVKGVNGEINGEISFSLPNLVNGKHDGTWV